MGFSNPRQDQARIDHLRAVFDIRARPTGHDVEQWITHPHEGMCSFGYARPPFPHELMHVLLAPYKTLSEPERAMMTDIMTGREVVAAAFSRQHYLMTLALMQNEGMRCELYAGAEYLTNPSTGGMVSLARIPHPFGKLLFGDTLEGAIEQGVRIEMPPSHNPSPEPKGVPVRHRLCYDGITHTFVLYKPSFTDMRVRHVQTPLTGRA